MTENMEPKSLSRRHILGGTAGLAGGAMLADFVLGSKPAYAAGGKPVTMAVIAQQMSAQSNQRSWNGLQQWLKTTGLDKVWNVNLTDAKGDPGELVSQVEDAITRKVDAILVMYGTLTAAHSALEDLKRSKIPFFTLDSGYAHPATADLTSNNYNMGGYTAEFMIDQLLGQNKKSANVCAIIADFHHGTRKRGKVFKTALTENTWINLQAERVIQYDGFFETTQNAVNDWLVRYGDSIDAIWCPWDEPAMAAAEVIISRNLQDKIFVVGADGDPSTIERMRQPNYPLLATVAQCLELWGAYVGWMINEIVAKGRPISQVVPAPSVEFPTPLIVKGQNLPALGSAAANLPWKTIGLDYIYEQRALNSQEA